MKKIIIGLLAITLMAGCATKEKSNTATENKDAAIENAPTPVTTPSTNDATSTTPADDANATSIEWIDPISKNLGSLTANKEVELVWRFRNTGDKPLIIESVSAQCGCTIPEKPEQPFAPGAEGVIKAKFNGVGSGTVSKQVYVVANTKNGKNHTLTFTGDIK